jgi:hypothetical protein
MTGLAYNSTNNSFIPSLEEEEHQVLLFLKKVVKSIYQR